jgi:hypothetical protein
MLMSELALDDARVDLLVLMLDCPYISLGKLL